MRGISEKVMCARTKVIKRKLQLDVEFNVLCPHLIHETIMPIANIRLSRPHSGSILSLLITKLTFQPGTTHFLDFWMSPDLVIMMMGLEIAKTAYIPKPRQPSVRSALSLYRSDRPTAAYLLLRSSDSNHT